MEIDEIESDYPTCKCCFASVTVDAGDLDPGFITDCLKIEPTSTWKKGELAQHSSSRVNPFSGWRLSSKGCVDSRDLRNHIDWLLDRFALRKAEMESLRAEGCVFRVWCYWLSKYGEGGPTISVPQAKRLAELELELGLDVYFLGEPDSENQGESRA
jgi:hypothetical protein